MDETERARHEREWDMIEAELSRGSEKINLAYARRQRQFLVAVLCTLGVVIVLAALTLAFGWGN